MPLDKRCSKAAADANFSTLYKKNKRNPQLSAIVLNVLKRSCGVDSKAKMSVDQIVAAGSGTESRRWLPLADLFEELPSSPAVRGLSFGLPGGMRGAGTCPASSPPDETRGLAGRAGPPIPLTKCPRCGRAYNKSAGRCPRCRAKDEAVNLAGGMRMDPLVGASATVACEGCGGPVRLGEKCRRCGREA
mgnify:CR=1 FL=1